MNHEASPLIHGPTHESPGGRNPLNPVAETQLRRRPRIPSHQCSGGEAPLGAWARQTAISGGRRPIESRCRSAVAPQGTALHLTRHREPGGKPLDSRPDTRKSKRSKPIEPSCRNAIARHAAITQSPMSRGREAAWNMGPTHCEFKGSTTN